MRNRAQIAINILAIFISFMAGILSFINALDPYILKFISNLIELWIGVSHVAIQPIANLFSVEIAPTVASWITGGIALFALALRSLMFAATEHLEIPNRIFRAANRIVAAILGISSGFGLAVLASLTANFISQGPWFDAVSQTVYGG
ncbi:hypothetical protein [Marinicauda salina]|uniref:hypothetical protein n=1 Tax=Marinicauda salina TaxID=2135793 RepID=UPI0011B24B61|nr:hypothetical protein [Marinicauda salina]